MNAFKIMANQSVSAVSKPTFTKEIKLIYLCRDHPLTLGDYYLYRILGLMVT